MKLLLRSGVLLRCLTRSVSSSTASSSSSSSSSASSSASAGKTVSKFSAAGVRVVVLTMNPDGGALGPALRLLGMRPYTFEDTYRYGHMGSHPKEWASVLRRHKRFDPIILQPHSGASSGAGAAEKESKEPQQPYDSFAGPPASLAFESVLAECPLSTRVVLLEEPDKLMWEKDYEMVMRGFIAQSAKGARRPIGEDFHAMVLAMSDLRAAALGTGCLAGGRAPYLGAPVAGATAASPLASPPLPPSTLLELYEERVTEVVPADRLLVYRLGDGWEPLCRFLSVPVPRGPDGAPLPFPKAETGLDSFTALSGRLWYLDAMTAGIVLFGLAVALSVLAPMRESVMALIADYRAYFIERLSGLRERAGETRKVSLRDFLIEAKRATTEYEEQHRDSLRVVSFLRSLLPNE